MKSTTVVCIMLFFWCVGPSQTTIVTVPVVADSESLSSNSSFVEALREGTLKVQLSSVGDTAIAKLVSSASCNSHNVFACVDMVCADLQNSFSKGFVSFSSTCVQSLILNHVAASLHAPQFAVQPVDCSTVAGQNTVSLGASVKILHQAAVSVLLKSKASKVCILFDRSHVIGAKAIMLLLSSTKDIEYVSYDIETEQATEQAVLFLEKIISGNYEYRHFILLASSERIGKMIDRVRNARPSNGYLNRQYFWIIIATTSSVKTMLPKLPSFANIAVIRDSASDCSEYAKSTSSLSCDPNEINEVDTRLMRNIAVFAETALLSNASKLNGTTCGNVRVDTSSTMMENLPKIIKEKYLLAEILQAATDHSTEYTNFRRVATYHQLDGIKMLKGQELWPNEFRSFHGKVLMVGSRNKNPFQIKLRQVDSPTGKYWEFTGIVIELVEELGRRLDFVPHYLIPADDKTGNPDGKGGWTGLVGQVIANETAFAAHTMTVSAARSTVVDFTTPFMEEPNGILMKKITGDNKFFRIIKPYHSYAWYMIAGSIVITGFCTWLICYISPISLYRIDPSEGVVDEIRLREHIWATLGTILEQGQDFYPNAYSGRIVVAFWWWATIVFVSSYTANFMAFLTVSDDPNTIRTLEDITKQDKVKPLIMKGTNLETMFGFSNNKIYQKIHEMMKDMPEVSGLAEAVNMTREGTGGDWAFINDYSPNEYNAIRYCSELRILPDIFNGGFTLAIAVPKNAYYLDLFNKHIRSILEMGIMYQLKRKWFKSDEKCADSTSQLNQASAIGLETAGGPFVVLGTCYGTGIIILIIELIATNVVKKPKKKSEDETYPGDYEKQIGTQ